MLIAVALTETSIVEPFSFFLLTQTVLSLQKRLKIFLIVTVAQINICVVITAIGAVV